MIFGQLRMGARQAKNAPLLVGRVCLFPIIVRIGIKWFCLISGKSLSLTKIKLELWDAREINVSETESKI